MKEIVLPLNPCLQCIAFRINRPCNEATKPCNFLTTRKDNGGTYGAMSAFMKKGGDWKRINHIKVG